MFTFKKKPKRVGVATSTTEKVKVVMDLSSNHIDQFEMINFTKEDIAIKGQFYLNVISKYEGEIIANIRNQVGSRMDSFFEVRRVLVTN